MDFKRRTYSAPGGKSGRFPKASFATARASSLVKSTGAPTGSFRIAPSLGVSHIESLFRRRLDRVFSRTNVSPPHTFYPRGPTVAWYVANARAVSTSESPPNFSSIAPASTIAIIASPTTPAAGTVQMSERS